MSIGDLPNDNSPLHPGAVNEHVEESSSRIKLVDDKDTRFDVAYKIFSEKPTRLQAIKQKLMQFFYAKMKAAGQKEIGLMLEALQKGWGYPELLREK